MQSLSAAHFSCESNVPADIHQQRHEIQIDGAGRTSGSYFKLQVDIESNGRCVKSRSNCAPAEAPLPKVKVGTNGGA